MQYRLNPIAAALFAGVFASGAAAAADTTSVGTISVQGDSDSTATGLIAPQDVPKARSEVSRSFIEKQSPATNPYQALALLPGVNTYSTDATGMFGGNIRVRGFNSDQLGFTINGAPVNDSGNFAVFPQEYTDTENLCSIFLTQGSTDTEAPHVGASGGNIGLQGCAPSDEFGITTAQTFGSNALTKTYIKAESGLIANKLKTYISYSHGMVDKWRGKGRADRHHVDIASSFDLGHGNKLSASLIYNYAVNNNFRAMTLGQYNTSGKYFDFGTVAPVHKTPVNGSAQTDTIPSDNYYKFSTNPFRNYIATGDASFRLSKDLNFDFQPYMWFGFGTGGNQLATLAEGSNANSIGQGVQDLNSDGDKLDTVIVYRSSVTTTYRPGATAKFTYNLNNANTIVVGGWVENARHRQTQPGELMGTPGGAVDSVANRWLDNSNDWLRYNNGMVYQGRDQLTQNLAYSAFVQDTILLFNDRLKIVPAFSHREIQRTFTNFPNSGTSGSYRGAGYYKIDYTSVGNLPSLGLSFALTDRSTIFADATRNMRVPSNFILQNLIAPASAAGAGSTDVYTNGVLTGYKLSSGAIVPLIIRQPNVRPESSNNFDLGYRYQSERFTFSGSIYSILFLNRIASAYDPSAAISTDYNVGTSTTKGVDLEGGVVLIPHVTSYTSTSYSISKIANDIQINATNTLPTAGKQFPDSPMWMFGERLQYAVDKYYGFVEGKYVGRRQSTLVNDENVPGYAVMNLGAGYTVGKAAVFKNLKLQLNMTNVTSQDYLNLNSGSGSSFTSNARALPGSNASAPQYFPGAPFAYALTINADF